MEFCDYSECTRRESCKTKDYKNCPIWQYFDLYRDTINEELRVFSQGGLIRATEQLEETERLNGMRGKRL